ncbi:MAG: Rpn family recombination-promoting nuclease/putative transposase [Candidatus Rhabdochlamydia sp.]
MALSKYLDPKNDIAFKKIFGSEKNKDILMHFLNNILGSFKNSPIVDIDFSSTILTPRIDKKKLSIVDILCKDEKGASYIIEMQVSANQGFEKRAQYYTSKVYSDQAMVGEEYQDLKKVVFIAIADYIIFSEPEDVHYKSEHAILNQKTKKQSLKDLCFVFIELPKFHKTKEELSSIEEKWCYFFKHAHEITREDLEKVIGKDHIINKAYTTLNKYYWTKKELMSYDKVKRARMDHQAILQYKFDEGEAKGLKKGIEKGKIEVAKRLLQDRFEIDMIIRSTGLSKEQVEELKKYILEENIVVNF